MSSGIVGWLVVIPMSIGLSWLIWSIWDNNRKLDSRLASGDVELLYSSSYKITEIVQAPAGSRIEASVSPVLPPGASGYIQQTLPDGRIAMIPVTPVHQPIQSVHSTTHTNQQPPEM